MNFASLDPSIALVSFKCSSEFTIYYRMLFFENSTADIEPR